MWSWLYGHGLSLSWFGWRSSQDEFENSPMSQPASTDQEKYGLWGSPNNLTGWKPGLGEGTALIYGGIQYNSLERFKEDAAQLSDVGSDIWLCNTKVQAKQETGGQTWWVWDVCMLIVGAPGGLCPVHIRLKRPFPEVHETWDCTPGGMEGGREGIWSLCRLRFPPLSLVTLLHSSPLTQSGEEVSQLNWLHGVDQGGSILNYIAICGIIPVICNGIN